MRKNEEFAEDEPVMPGQLPIKAQLVVAGMAAVADLVCEASGRACELSPNTDSSVFLDTTPVDVLLRSIGADCLRFDSAFIDGFERVHFNAQPGTGAVGITMSLSRGGRPLALEEDVSDGLADILDSPQPSHNYTLVLAPEMPPVLVQALRLDESLSSQQWNLANKHELANGDCEVLLGVLPMMSLADD